MTTFYRTAAGALTERDAYFFDLYGFVIVKNALTAAQLAACNSINRRLAAPAPGRVGGGGAWAQLWRQGRLESPADL